MVERLKGEWKQIFKKGDYEMKLPKLSEMFVTSVNEANSLDEDRLSMAEDARKIYEIIKSADLSKVPQAISVAFSEGKLTAFIDLDKAFPEEELLKNGHLKLSVQDVQTSVNGYFKPLAGNEWTINLNIVAPELSKKYHFEKTANLREKRVEIADEIRQKISPEHKSVFIHELTHKIEKDLNKGKWAGPASAKAFGTAKSDYSRSREAVKAGKEGEAKEMFKQFFANAAKYYNVSPERSARLQQLMSDFMDKLVAEKDYRILKSFPLFYSEISKELEKRNLSPNVANKYGEPEVHGLKHKEMIWLKRSLFKIWEQLKNKYGTEDQRPFAKFIQK